MMTTLKFATDRPMKSINAPLVVGLGIVSAYGITMASTLMSVFVFVPIVLILFLFLGGLGLLVGVASTVWIVWVSCLIVHLVVFFIVRPKLKPHSLFRTRHFTVGYCLYFLIAPSLAFYSTSILTFFSGNSSNIERSGYQTETISTLSIYLPSLSRYRRERANDRIRLPVITDLCSTECALILAESNVKTIVQHYKRRSSPDSRSRKRLSYRFTFIDRDACRLQDGRLRLAYLKKCLLSEEVPYAPPQGFYVDVQRARKGNILVAKSEATLHLRKAEGSNVTDIATFRSGVHETTAFFKALIYPFSMTQVGSKKNPDVIVFGYESIMNRGVVSPMVGLLRYLAPHEISAVNG